MSETRAVVIGGSLAGLSAARVLSDYFDRVTVIERDHYPAGIADRAGAPQGRHHHTLFTRGLIEFERLFPGFQQTCIQRGALLFDHSWDLAKLDIDGWLPPYRSGLTSLSSSRALIESVVRDGTFRLSNVSILEDTEVTALITSQQTHRRCLGVTTRSRNDADTVSIDADLVVDASGSGSKAARWLREAGIEPPTETLVDPLGAYSSRFYQGPPRDKWPSDWWWCGLRIFRDYSSRNRDATTAFFGRIENDVWHLSIQTIGELYPPTDEDGFTALLSRLRSPIIHEMTRVMKPVSRVFGMRNLENRWRRYARWRAPFDRFIAVGDAACRSDPVAALGMSAAAVSASILRDHLDKYGLGSPELSHRFLAAQAQFQNDPWRIAAGADLRFRSTLGERTLPIRLYNRHQDAMSIAIANETVRQRFAEVMRLVKPVSSLYSPRVMVPAFIHGTRFVAQHFAEKLARSPEPPGDSATRSNGYGLPVREAYETRFDPSDRSQVRSESKEQVAEL